MATYWLNVLWMMASQLYWDKQEGFLELYIMAPTSLMAILLGMGVGGLYMSTLTGRGDRHRGHAAVRCAVRREPVGLRAARLPGDDGRPLWAGMMLSSVFLMWGREAWQVALALHEPVFFLSGMNFPLSKLFTTMPGVLTFVSAWCRSASGSTRCANCSSPDKSSACFHPPTKCCILAGAGRGLRDRGLPAAQAHGVAGQGRSPSESSLAIAEENMSDRITGPYSQRIQSAKLTPGEITCALFGLRPGWVGRSRATGPTRWFSSSSPYSGLWRRR